MISVVAGAVIFGGGVAGLWACMPDKGKPKAFVIQPIFAWLVPTAIVSALAIGAALFASGIVG